MTQNINEPLHIIGTDLLDYSFKVEKAIKEGYTFSDLNMYAPRAWPHMFEAFMVKSLAEIKEDFAKQQEVEQVANIATNVAEKTTKQVNRRGVKK